MFVKIPVRFFRRIFCIWLIDEAGLATCRCLFTTIGMSALLSTHTRFSPNVVSVKEERAFKDISSASLVSASRVRQQYGGLLFSRWNGLMLRAELRQTGSRAKLGTNGSAIQMVPTSEIVKRKSVVKKVEIINGSEKVGSGTALVKVAETPAELRKSEKLKQLPPAEELEPVISIKSYSWSNENYSSFHRNIEVWSLIISLRVRHLLDNAKWTYVGGFSEDKKVSFPFVSSHCSLEVASYSISSNLIFHLYI